MRGIACGRMLRVPPLLRSRILWSGVLLVLLLSGLWADSRRHVRGLGALRGVFEESASLIHGEGSIEISYQQMRHGSTGGPWNFATRHDPVVGTPRWFLAPRWLQKDYPTVHYYELRIPYWFLIVMTVAVWGLLLTRRAWKRNRMAAETMIPEAESKA
ncbi:hypothetical protein [Luteolibacter rhizosphaerae]|uniref:hypothetical protein n=1 Tax=Luteolibacter rhizosphaerae TaxID=2989719 RepID=UPI0022233038|nr:hypothetical protein [Luteolibacter rhizosphaerae]